MKRERSVMGTLLLDNRDVDEGKMSLLDFQEVMP